ncbi:MAG: N-acetylmuramoyl-L-alanine amidase family protein [Clostridia bacterium]|nr:N-acetylmuramoyl-L-alanine amidase family protein [Clostridia bacterium]
MSGTIYSYKINGDEWKDITAAGTTTVISVGNTAIEKGKLAVCIKKTETHFQGDELTNETPFTAYLEGKVTINKMTGVTSGDTLTAQVTGQQSGAKLHYEWTANGTKVGTDKSSYTVSDNDAGKIIAVKVTADGYVKSLASGKTSAVVKKQSSVTWKPGWQQVNNQWYYGNSNGKIATGWVNVGSKWYLMSESGAMLTGWQTVNGTRYYLSSSTSDGSMKTGWQNIGGQWYYMNRSGAMLTGWQKINEKWYYLSTSDGTMKYGWQKIASKWYYLGASNDGAMKYDWQKLGNNWYYLGTSSDGAMKIGWQKLGGYWYYLGSSPDDGAMKTGWQKVNGTWYYLYGNVSPAGHMAAQTWVEGKYYVDASGAWTQTR